MKKILVKRNDGGVSIIVPGDSATPETMERDARAVPGYVSHREIDDSDIPADRAFRDAWEDSQPGPQVDINLDKVKEVVRKKRNAALERLDVEAIKEQRKPNGNVEEINIKAQELRNIPQNDARFKSDNLEELKKLAQELDNE